MLTDAGSVYANGVNATGGITAGTSGQGDGNSNMEWIFKVLIEMV